MLQAVPGDAAVDAHLGIVVAGDTLPLLIGPVAVLPKPGPRRTSRPSGHD